MECRDWPKRIEMTQLAVVQRSKRGVTEQYGKIADVVASLIARRVNVVKNKRKKTRLKSEFMSRLPANARN